MPKYPPPSPPYAGPPFRHSGKGNKPIKRIVLHGTVSPTVEGGARSIAAYFRGRSAGGSAHYVIDPGETVQTAYDDVVAWHAPPNGNSIGLELCDPVGGAKGPLPVSRWFKHEPHRRMIRRAARLTAELCLAYDVPIRFVGPRQLRAGARGICEHDDVSKAWRQSSHWDLGLFPRRHFLELTKAAAAELRQDAAGKARAEKRADSRVTRARDLLEAALKRPKLNAARRRRIRKGLDALPKH